MEDLKDILKNTMKHITTGVSYMVPVIVSCGLLFAIAVIFGGTAPEEGTFWYNLKQVGSYGTGLYVAVFSMFTAYSIADRPGLCPGLIGGYIAIQRGTGFIGAIVAGLTAGIIAYYCKKMKLPASLKPMLPLVIIPLVSVFAEFILFYYLIGSPLAAATKALGSILTSLQTSGRVALGAVIGAFAGFDYGGPINKTAVVFCNGLFADGITGPRAWFNCGNPSAPVAVALATLLAPKKFTTVEKQLAPSTALMGLFGITEGVIPFALNDPLHMMPATIIGSAVGSALGSLFNLETMITWSGMVCVPGISNKLLYFVCWGAAILVTTAILVVFKKPAKEEDDQDVNDFIGA